MREALKEAKALAIPFDEYDRCSGRPQYFKWENTPLFVILEDYDQCEQWMGEILEEDLYFVNLYPEDVQNFYTVLFFRRRKEPEVLFVFPTLKHLAEMLIRKWNLRDKILTSQNQDSLKLFACFGDEIHMLQAITWLMSFVSGTGWNGSQLQQAASMLCVGLVKSLLESALQIRVKEYWNYRSSLPRWIRFRMDFIRLWNLSGGRIRELFVHRSMEAAAILSFSPVSALQEHMRCGCRRAKGGSWSQWMTVIGTYCGSI